MPPKLPATAWVWKTAIVSSTCFSNQIFLCRNIMLNHGMDPDINPIKIAAHPCTTPES